MVNTDHFDAVIVGSGFGGSVTAYRLAEAGLTVCLLERGKPYPPGSFPRTPREMKANFWDPSEGLYGLFNIWSFKGVEAVISSGLAGGSLIYANVLLRKDEKWFVREDLANGGFEYWPVTRRDLDPHYDEVERMLNAQRFPFDQEPYSQTPKTRAFQQAAKQLGQEWELPNLGISFASPGQPPGPGLPIVEPLPNLHRVPRSTCRMCGECDIGCNFGSKNTLDFNYLTEAERLGASIRPLCEVREFEPAAGGGYTVRYVEHDLERRGQRTNTSGLALETVHASRLVLCAGTLGTTYLLLRNRHHFPRLSLLLGTRFSGNGDLLTFAMSCKEHLGDRVAPRRIEATYGPVITSAIRVPDALDGGRGRGFYLEDAGFPGLVDWIVEMSTVSSRIGRLLRFAFRYACGLLGMNPNSNLSGEVSHLLDAWDMEWSSMPLLGMGRDVPDGRMRLRGKYLEVDWRIQRSRPLFDRMRRLMQEVAVALGGTFADAPLWHLLRTITVHPLGGCPMGLSEHEGVVDGYGEVFNYPGFFIADGSVMPGPVGANPSLTIAAFADRAADRICGRA
jgi:cholesterol oxidase